MNIIERVDNRFWHKTVNQYLDYPAEVKISITKKSVRAGAELIGRTKDIKTIKAWIEEEKGNKGRVTMLINLEDRLKRLEGGR